MPKIAKRYRLPRGATTPSGHTSRKAKDFEPLPSRVEHVEPPPSEHQIDGEVFAKVDPDPWPVRNTELFNRVATIIELFPESYNQGDFGTVYDCGTTCCIAGHGAAQTGWLPASAHYKIPTPRDVRLQLLRWGSVWREDEKVLADVSEVARIEYGLTRAEEDILFSGSWSPPTGVTVPEALRRIGQGERISALTALSSLFRLRAEERERFGEVPVWT